VFSPPPSKTGPATCFFFFIPPQLALSWVTQRFDFFISFLHHPPPSRLFPPFFCPSSNLAQSGPSANPLLFFFSPITATTCSFSYRFPLGFENSTTASLDFGLITLGARSPSSHRTRPVSPSPSPPSQIRPSNSDLYSGSRLFFFFVTNSGLSLTPTFPRFPPPPSTGPH